MTLDESTLAHANNFGALNYDDETMALILKSTPAAIRKLMKKGPFADAYEHGAMMNTYRIDQKLLEMAQSGDLKAIAKLEERGAGT